MRPCDVRTPEQALAYVTDCTLATVSSIVMKKTRCNYEYERQINIAQKACDWMEEMKIDPVTTRAEDIIGKCTVAEWAKQYLD